MRHARFVKWVAVAALAVSAVATSPADAAVRAKPAKTQTWIGAVERRGGQFDYVGRPCPTGSGMLCANYVARYRIVALNAATEKALRHVAGGQARLRAQFSPAQDKHHRGTLRASSVEQWCPPDGGCVPPPAGHTVKIRR